MELLMTHPPYVYSMWFQMYISEYFTYSTLLVDEGLTKSHQYLL